MIGTVTLNPSVDQNLTVRRLVKDDALRVEKVAWFAGGKGVNVSRVVQALGGKSCAFGFVGGFPGKMLTSWLDQAGIRHHLTAIDGETRINTTVTDLADRTQTHLRSPGPRVTPRELRKLTRQLLHCRVKPHFWVLGGSLPPGTPGNFYEKLINRLEQTGAHCVLDADEEAMEEGLKGTPFMIKPNEHEFKRLTGKTAGSDRQIVETARGLVRKGVQVVLVTLGPRGAVAVTAEDVFRVDTPKVRVKSKVGAGDSTIAGCLVGILKGWPLREAVRYGVACGTAAVLTEGTQLCEPKEVKKILPRIKIRNLPF